MIEEVWLPLVGNYSCRYEVSNLGRVRTLGRLSDICPRDPLVLKECKTGKEYFYVNLGMKESKQKKFYTHHLVAAAFLGPRPEGMIVNHKNSNRLDNRSENLEYTTQSKNVSQAFDHGNAKHGIKHPNRKYTLRDVDRVRSLLKTETNRAKIARQLKVSRYFVDRLYQNKSWIRHETKA